MNTTSKLITVLGLIAVFTAETVAHCGTCPVSQNSESEHRHHGDHGKENNLGLVPHYLKVQESLAAEDLKISQSAADDLLKAIPDGSTMNEFQEIHASAKEISTSENMLGARKAFLTLSNEFIAGTEGLELPEGQELYLTYCPMAFGNTGGHWLQKDTMVNNPYFGAQMLRCGSVKSRVGADEKTSAGHKHH